MSNNLSDVDYKIADALQAAQSDAFELCLPAIQVLKAGGRIDDAASALERIAELPQALSNVSQIVDLAAQMKQPDIIDKIWVQLADDDEKIRIGFLAIDQYLEKKLPGKASNILNVMRESFYDDNVCLRKIADIYFKMANFGAARDIYEKLRSASPGDAELTFRFTEAELRAQSKEGGILPETIKYLKKYAEKSQDISSLYSISEMFFYKKYDYYGRFALKRAVDVSGRRQDCLLRYLWALSGGKKKLRLRVNVWRSLRAETIDSLHYRYITILTLHSFPRSKLALRFAQRQYEMDQHSIEATIFLIRTLYQLGMIEAARQMVAVIFDSRKAEVSPQQWKNLGEVVFAADVGPLAKSIASEILARDSDDKAAKAILETKYALGFLN